MQTYAKHMQKYVKRWESTEKVLRRNREITWNLQF